MPEELKTIRERASRISFPHRVWSRLASEPNSVIYPQNISNWLAGDVTSKDKVRRLMAVLESVENLVKSVAIRPDLSDAAVVVAALKRLKEKKQEPVATAPFVGRSAAAAYDAEQTTSATAILATPLEK